MAGPEMMLISAGLQLFQGFQAYQQGKAQAKVAQQTAAYNAQVDKQHTDVERMQLKRQQRLFAATQRTRAAGTRATLGSFDDLFEDTQTQSLLDVALLNYDGKLRQQQILYGGSVEAANAKASGRSGLISGLVGAGGSLYTYNKDRQKSQQKNSTYYPKTDTTVYWNNY